MANSDQPELMGCRLYQKDIIILFMRLPLSAGLVIMLMEATVFCEPFCYVNASIQKPRLSVQVNH